MLLHTGIQVLSQFFLNESGFLSVLVFTSEHADVLSRNPWVEFLHRTSLPPQPPFQKMFQPGFRSIVIQNQLLKGKPENA